MSKPVKEYAKHLFYKLLGDLLSEDERNQVFLEKDENIKEELELFNAMKVGQEYSVMQGIDSMTFSVDGFEFVAFKGESVPSFDFDGGDGSRVDLFDIYEVGAGLFLRLVKDFNLTKTLHQEPQKREEDLAAQHLDEQYNGHTLYDCKRFIEPFIVVKINQQSALSGRPIEGKVHCLLSFSESLINLPFNSVCDQLRFIFIENPTIPTENFFYAMTSMHWQHAFLEIYRCLEALYGIPRAKMLKKELGLNISTLDVIEKAEKKLGWHPNERMSLKELFRYVSTETLKKPFEFQLIGNGGEDGDDLEGRDKLIDKEVDLIYETRNKLVHSSINSGNIYFEDWYWRSLVGFLVALVDDIYSELIDEIKIDEQ